MEGYYSGLSVKERRANTQSIVYWHPLNHLWLEDPVILVVSRIGDTVERIDFGRVNIGNVLTIL
jgi:hypothetical protein